MHESMSNGYQHPGFVLPSPSTHNFPRHLLHARDLGLTVHAEAKQFTIDGLLEAVLTSTE